MRQPRPGESVFLFCKKCKHSFVGAYPDRHGLELFNNKGSKTKCPKCDSSQIILNPCVRY